MTIELAALSEAGAGLVVGTVAADGTPRATRAWSAEVVERDGADRIRFVVTADDPVVVENLAGEFVCLNGADVLTLRSVQWKGRIVAVEAVNETDLELVAAHTHRFFGAVHQVDGTPLEILGRLRPLAVLAVEMTVEETFDQTPGPHAGASIGGSPR